MVARPTAARAYCVPGKDHQCGKAMLAIANERGAQLGTVPRAKTPCMGHEASGINTAAGQSMSEMNICVQGLWDGVRCFHTPRARRHVDAEDATDIDISGKMRK